MTTSHSQKLTLGRVRKAIVALGSAVGAVALALGTSIDATAIAAVEGAVVSVLVFAVPND